MTEKEKAGFIFEDESSVRYRTRTLDGMLLAKSTRKLDIYMLGRAKNRAWGLHYAAQLWDIGDTSWSNLEERETEACDE